MALKKKAFLYEEKIKGSLVIKLNGKTFAEVQHFDQIEEIIAMSYTIVCVSKYVIIMA